MVEIYTDGSFSHQSKNGGWAIVVVKDDEVIDKKYGKVKHGSGPNVTSNRMELQAIIEALEYTNDDLVILSDSKYCVDGCNLWMKNWKKQHWKRTVNKHVKNKDLWQRIDSLLRDNVTIKWIKGHNGNKFNELADSLSQNHY